MAHPVVQAQKLYSPNPEFVICSQNSLRIAVDIEVEIKSEFTS
jgi:hypothetical protein